MKELDGRVGPPFLHKRLKEALDVLFGRMPVIADIISRQLIFLVVYFSFEITPPSQFLVLYLCIDCLIYTLPKLKLHK